VFDEIKLVEENISKLKDDLINIKDGVDGHFNQLDDIAAHIIAIEGILTEVLKITSVESTAIKDWIVEATKDSSGNETGSVKAQMVVDELLGSKTDGGN